MAARLLVELAPAVIRVVAWVAAVVAEAWGLALLTFLPRRDRTMCLARQGLPETSQFWTGPDSPLR